MQATAPLVRSRKPQEPQVLVAMLQSNNVDVEHNRKSESGGNRRRPQERPTHSPTRHPGLGEGRARKTSVATRYIALTVSFVGEDNHRIALVCTFKPLCQMNLTYHAKKGMELSGGCLSNVIVTYRYCASTPVSSANVSPHHSHELHCPTPKQAKHKVYHPGREAPRRSNRQVCRASHEGARHRWSHPLRPKRELQKQGLSILWL